MQVTDERRIAMGREGLWSYENVEIPLGITHQMILSPR
jgi:hypothetical protein